MDIVILFSKDYPQILDKISLFEGTNQTILKKSHDIYDHVIMHQFVHVSHKGWDFICMNIDNCFKEQFSDILKNISKDHELYMMAVNNSSNGLWFEYYNNAQLKRQWMEVNFVITGNMGEYLEAEENLNYPFVDESYENVGEEMLYELVYEITGYDITETF